MEGSVIENRLVFGNDRMPGQLFLFQSLLLPIAVIRWMANPELIVLSRLPPRALRLRGEVQCFNCRVGLSLDRQSGGPGAGDYRGGAEEDVRERAAEQVIGWAR